MEDPRSPDFLHHTDHHGSVVINLKLTSSNYCSWSRSFLLALSIRNKTGFIDGSTKQPSLIDGLYSSWTHCNNLNVAWLLESISEPIATNVFYMSSVPEIWQTLKNRFSQLDDTRICNLQFSLCNKTQALRSHIIMIKPFLSVDEAYNLVLREESQGSISMQNQALLETTTMAIVIESKRRPKNDVTCSHCDKNGHVKDKCFRIIGFPPDFKFTKGKGNNIRKAMSTLTNSANKPQIEH
ncbi:Uncharacterized protein TCM_025870 [Theobroma cacao]|uniref:Retrotransposon Copia-like N-terminal domain-containing protein n=1 Tax=Theobroma cacao TaxID=3641 RepID=A0A061EZK1_THECC|nr:Uncharacterized protein TCM_025870 [Theobroma cacao]